MNIPRTLKQYTAPARKMQAIDVVRKTSFNLHRFIDEITNHGPCHFVIPIGKSFYFYRNVLSSLILQGSTYGLIKVLYHPHQVLGKHLRLKDKKKVAILVDSIRKGKEINELHDVLQENNIEVTHIFSYLTNLTSLDNLEKNGFPIEKIISFITVKDSDYSKNFSKIQIYLQSRIEPIAHDSTYELYRLSGKIDTDRLISIVETAISSAMNCKNIKFKRNKSLHVHNHVFDFDFGCKKINECKKNPQLFEKIPNIGKLVFSDANIGIKVVVDENKFLKLRLSATYPLDCILKGLVPKDYYQCSYRTLMDQNCNLLKFPTENRDSLKYQICALCINCVVSNHVLDIINKSIEKALTKNSIKFTSQRFIPLLLIPNIK